MNEKFIPFLLYFYSCDVIKMICEKYKEAPEVAMRKLLFSETFRMLSTPSLAMWEFSPLGIFDMWETEQKTGDPRKSIYFEEA